MANKNNVSIKFSGNAVTTGVALVIIGVLFCILQGAAVQALITTLGVLFILMGAIDLMHKNWVVGAIELVVGVVVIVCAWLILEITLLWALCLFCTQSIFLRQPLQGLRARAFSAKSQSYSSPCSLWSSEHCSSRATGAFSTNFSSRSAHFQSRPAQYSFSATR